MSAGSAGLEQRQDQTTAQPGGLGEFSDLLKQSFKPRNDRPRRKSRTPSSP